MITVPQGGIDAGRAAQVDISQQPDLGGVVAQAAGAVAEKFGQIKAQQRAIQVESTKLDIVKDIGTERQRFDQMTDPAQIDAEWPQVEAAIMDKYINAKGPDGKPLLTPEEADALGLTIKDMSTRHGLALGERAINLTQSQATAAWTAARLDIVNTAATADPDTMVALIEFGEAAIDQRLAAGIIMPADAETEKAAFRAEVANARLTGAITSDPAAALADLDAGEYNELGAETVAARKATAQAELDRIAAAEAKAAEAQNTETNRIIGQKLEDIEGVISKGGTLSVADRDLLKDPAYVAHPKAAATIAAVTLADEKPGLAMMTPAQKRKLLAEEMAKPDTAPYQVERQAYLEGLIAEDEKGWATDGAAQAKKVGLPIPELDPENLDALPEAIARRMAYAEQLQRQGYVKDARTAVMDETERSALRALTAPEADLQPKLDLALAIATGTKGNADWLNRTIGADPVFAEATRVLIETGSSELANSILRGQQKVALGNVVLPPKTALIDAFNTATGGVYEDDPTAAARIREAAAALYADTARGLNPDGVNSAIPFMDDVAAVEAFTVAVRRVTGATPDAKGNLTVGGAQPYRDAIVPLPPGVPLEALEGAVENIGRQMQGEVFYEPAGRYAPADKVPGANPSTIDPLRAFRAASVDARGKPDGRTPDIDDPGLLDILQIQKVPGRKNEYRFVYPGDGRPQIVVDANGLEYRFRMDALIRGAEK